LGDREVIMAEFESKRDKYEEAAREYKNILKIVSVRIFFSLSLFFSSSN